MKTSKHGRKKLKTVKDRKMDRHSPHCEEVHRTESKPHIQYNCHQNFNDILIRTPPPKSLKFTRKLDPKQSMKSCVERARLWESWYLVLLYAVVNKTEP